MFQSGPRGPAAHPRPAPPRPAPTPAIRQLVNPVTPYRAPAPTPHSFAGSIGGALQHAAPAVHNAVQQATTPHQAGAGPHNAFTRTPQYKQAVAQVFHEQPTAAKAAIIRGISRANAFNTPEYQAIRNQWDHISIPERDAISNLIPKDLSKFIAPKPGPDIFGDIAKIFNPSNVYGSGKTGSTQGGGSLAGVSVFGGPKGGAQLLKNLGSDVVNYLPNTVQGLYGLGKDIQQGHIGQAVGSLVDPFVKTFAHPAQSFYQHPGNTAAMFLGPKAIIGRGLGGIARSGVAGDAAAAAAGTARADLHLGTVAGEPSPIVEARSYSNDVFNKAIQVSREKYLKKRGRNPNIAQPAPGFLPPSVKQAFNVGPEAKLNRIADEMTTVRQMAGRQERARALHDLHKAAPPKAARNIVGHALQGVLRTPETAAVDAVKEANRLKAVQTGKRTPGEILNRKQVRDLETALKTPGAFEQAFKAAEVLRPLLHGQDSYLAAKGLLDPEQALRSRLFPYAQAHMGATYNHAHQRLEVPGSAGRTRPLDTQEIIDHLDANHVPDPAYVGHFPGKVAPHRFYQAYKLARGTIANSKRTGEAFRTGAYDHSFEGLAGQIASRTEAVTKASLHDKVVNRLGIVPSKPVLDRLGIKSDNGLLTPAEAQRVAHAAVVDDHGNPIPNATELTPISTAPKNALSLVKNLQNPHELNNISGIELKALAHAVEDAANRTDQTRNVALIPTVAAQRFAQQFAKTDSMMRSIGHVTQQFRRTVLPYSTHWMLQIGSEAGLRALIGGALSPHYLADGRRLMTRLEKTEPGRAALHEMVNATFYNKHDPLAVHNPNPNALVAGARAFPPTKVLIAAHNRYADTIGHAMYSLEHNARLMGLGKLAHKEVAEFASSWKNAVRLQGGSIEHLARRLETNPALVAKLGRQIDDTFGKYNKFSPKVRGAIQSIAPFLPWYLNAAKYVLWHLPVHHPVATALLASLRQTMNQDVQDGKQMPLNTFAMQELARISPFGIFSPDSPSPGDALKEVMRTGSSVFLPQVMGSLYNLAGVNSFGDSALKGPRGDVKAGSGPSRAASAENLAEAFIPLLSKVRELREGGKPSYSTSTIVKPQPKPGGPSASTGHVLNRLFNPFYSFERAKNSSSSSGRYLLGGSSSAGGSSNGSYLLGGQSSSGSGGYLLP